MSWRVAVCTLVDGSNEQGRFCSLPLHARLRHSSAHSSTATDSFPRAPCSIHMKLDHFYFSGDWASAAVSRSRGHNAVGVECRGRNVTQGRRAGTRINPGLRYTTPLALNGGALRRKTSARRSGRFVWAEITRGTGVARSRKNDAPNCFRLRARAFTLPIARAPVR
jgi:hypothetical protein